jgi:hypothetical protein
VTRNIISRNKGREKGAPSFCVGTRTVEIAPQQISCLLAMLMFVVSSVVVVIVSSVP